MKTLLILRHAKSSWKEPGRPDHDRPLNARGKHDAPRMGRLLRDEGLVPDVIISSTARRARKTAAQAASECGYQGEIELTDDLYLAGPGTYLSVLRQLDDDFQRAMVVGHNPGLTALIETLTDEFEDFPTAALAHLVLPVKYWRDLRETTQGELVRIWRPKELDGSH